MLVECRTRAVYRDLVVDAPVSQLAEEADLKSACCRFESDPGHTIYTFRIFCLPISGV